MSETILSDILAELRRPRIPLEDELWDAHDLAGYFKVSPRTAAEKIAARPSFPNPIRVSGTRWRAGDVIEWARRQRGTK